MDFESEEDYMTDSESEDEGQRPYWRQRRSGRGDEDAGGVSGGRSVRRSPRLAARAAPQMARRSSQRMARRPN